MPDSSTLTVESFVEGDTLSGDAVGELRRLVYGSEKHRSAVKRALSSMEADSSVMRNHSKAYKLALFYWFVDRDEEAIKLLGAHLKSQLAYATYLRWCLVKEMYAQAAQKGKQGLDEFSKDTELQLLYAQAVLRLGELDEAKKVAQRVKKALSPFDIEEVRARVQELEAREDEAAAGEAQESADVQDDVPQSRAHSDLLYLQGSIEEAQGNWERAIELFDDAIIADRENIFARFRKAYNLDLHGIDEEAIETYERARRLRPLHTNILLNLGVLYEDIGRNRKAIQCYRTILEDNPNHDRAKLFLSDAEASRYMVFDEEEEKEQGKLLHILQTPITDFELSVRSRNCLAKMSILTLGDLSRKTESELLSYKNFGETSLAEIKELLISKSLNLGMGSEDLGGVAAAAAEAGEEVQERASSSGLLDTLLNDLNFSVRSKRAFEKLGVHTLDELINTSEADFQGIRNFGQTSLNEIKEKLAEYGLVLR